MARWKTHSAGIRSESNWFGIVSTFLMSDALFPAQDVRQHLHRHQWHPEGWRSTSEPRYSFYREAFIHFSCVLLRTLTHQLETHELGKTGTFKRPLVKHTFQFFSHINWPRAKSNHRCSPFSYVQAVLYNQFKQAHALAVKTSTFCMTVFSVPANISLQSPQEASTTQSCSGLHAKGERAF